jgi:hypothetical protein
VNAVRNATRQLVYERFMLQEDADRLINAAEASDILRGVGADESAEGSRPKAADAQQ